MKHIILTVLLLAAWITAQAQSADTLTLNRDVSLIQKATSLKRGQYSLDANLSLYFNKEVKVLGFYYNKRRLNNASGQFKEVTEPGEKHLRRFELRNITTTYTLYDAQKQPESLKERLVLKYSRNKKTFYVMIPLTALSVSVMRPAGAESGKGKN